MKKLLIIPFLFFSTLLFGQTFSDDWTYFHTKNWKVDVLVGSIPDYYFGKKSQGNIVFSHKAHPRLEVIYHVYHASEMDSAFREQVRQIEINASDSSAPQTNDKIGFTSFNYNEYYYLLEPENSCPTAEYEDCRDVMEPIMVALLTSFRLAQQQQQMEHEKYISKLTDYQILTDDTIDYYFGYFCDNDIEGRYAIDRLVKDRNIDTIKLVLDGDNEEGQIYAIISLLEMGAAGEITLTETEKMKIKTIIEQNFRIGICSGGVYSAIESIGLFNQYCYRKLLRKNRIKINKRLGQRKTHSYIKTMICDYRRIPAIYHNTIWWFQSLFYY